MLVTMELATIVDYLLFWKRTPDVSEKICALSVAAYVQ